MQCVQFTFDRHIINSNYISADDMRRLKPILSFTATKCYLFVIQELQLFEICLCVLTYLITTLSNMLILID